MKCSILNQQSLAIYVYIFKHVLGSKQKSDIKYIISVFFWWGGEGNLFFNTFSVTRPYNVDDRVTNEWWWWIDTVKHLCLKQDSNPQCQRPRDKGLCLRTVRPLGPAILFIESVKLCEVVEVFLAPIVVSIPLHFLSQSILNVCRVGKCFMKEDIWRKSNCFFYPVCGHLLWILYIFLLNHTYLRFWFERNDLISIFSVLTSIAIAVI
jgi:hypothetical protein